MESTEIIDLIDEQDWVEPVADSLSAGVKAAFDAVGPAAQPIKNALHGTWLGHSLHPVLTDIPVGAWSVAAILDVAETFGRDDLAPGADAAIAIGLLGATGAAITGLTDWHAIDDDKPKKLGAVHAVLNIAATAAYLGSWVLRKNGQRGIAKFLSGTGFGLVGVSAYLGGMLVFDQRIGVDHADRENVPTEWQPVILDSELEEAVPKCAKAGNFEVVLVKTGETVQALGNLCSHLGGPLCEGKVEDGTIVCPWHGSKFSLGDGSVIDGPATVPQPALVTRIVDGQLEVKGA